MGAAPEEPGSEGRTGTGAGIAGVAVDQLVNAAFRRARVGMAITDALGNFLAVNDALSSFVDYPVRDLTTMSFRDITLIDDLPHSTDQMTRLTDGNQSEFTLDKRYVTASDDVVWGRLTATAVHGVNGEVARVIVQVEDLSERMRVSAALHRRDTHDDLTGLANRRLLYQRLHAALADPRRSARRVALLVINLDRFQQVNAGIGPGAADEILTQAAARLSAVARGRDTVARLGGDEFAILAPDTTPEDAIALAVSLRRQLGRTYWVTGSPIVVSARVGVVTAPRDGIDGETLMRRAASAVEQAKALSSGWATHAEPSDTVRHNELGLVGDLRAAIDNGDITVAYQPIVDREGLTHSVEVLARWYHQERGAVPPDQFIVVAEQNGLIGPLTTHVLTQAIHQAVAWAPTLGSVPVAVNLSGKLLGDPRLLDQVGEIVAAAGLPPGLLTLEITETAIADGHNPDIIATLSALRRAGVRIAIDDFGTGYSSLGYLRQLPVDELKIDRSFIIDLDADPRTQRIVRSIIDLAHSLELTVVAEGVEDRGSASRLLQLGIDYLQGYFLAKPDAVEVTTDWLAAHLPTAPTTRTPNDGARTMDVLIVDDHPGVRAALRERLAQRDHRVDEARNGTEALDRVQTTMPDLVILNDPKPGGSGIEIAPLLRNAAYTGPILLFSGSSPEDIALIRFPLDVWPVSQIDDETLMRLVDGYAANASPMHS